MDNKYPKPFLDDFCRRQWVSEASRDLWEPRISRIGAQFNAAEIASVEVGMRTAALQNISPEMLPELAKRAAEKQLIAIPLGTQGRSDGYSASPLTVTPGQPWDYRVVITRIQNARDFLSAWKCSDDDRIGYLLGYPDCCTQYFSETWGEGCVDPTWYAAESISGEHAPMEANILLRWLGVRYIPHMPCSLDCKGSAEFGEKMRMIVAPPERGWMDELLSMPMMWSAVNSIGEVVTPIVTVNFRSDPAPIRREIRRVGDGNYPEGSATGVRFPYMERAQVAVDDQAWRNEEVEDSREWTDNGFSSAKAMENAHKIIEAVRPPVEGGRSVLDLGCGNGLLARRMAGQKGRAEGIEIDPGRAERAQDNLDFVEPYDLSDIDIGRLHPRMDLVLLMPGRLAGDGKRRRQADRIIKDIRKISKDLLVYAYDDTLKEYGSLYKICAAAGLVGLLENEGWGHGVEAGIWRFEC